MIPGIAGTLLSLDALERVIPQALSGQLGEATAAAARRRLRAWHRLERRSLGPASSARTLCDRLALPLAAHLGYTATLVPAAGGRLVARLAANDRAVACLIVTAWRSTGWRDAVLAGLALGHPWCLCLNGPDLYIVDVRRTFARRFTQIDLTAALDDDRAFAVMWGLLRAEAMAHGAEAGGALLDRAVRLSEGHTTAVRASLQEGVHEALTHFTGAFRHALGPGRAGRAVTESRLRSESLVIVYRLLFLLFAEARGLVPSWHAVYRRAYTIESLRAAVEQLPRPRGLWEALQAIARLAHHGCHAGTLTVEPFNGPLFSPSRAPLADTLTLDDGRVRGAVLALTTRSTRSGRERIAYGDLGVEQLGAVYERLLDDESAAGRAGQRRETGSFYTPRALTEYLVRRTLAPLVAGAAPTAILSLRILDPAMGSGAFLVAACRYLASAYERALVGTGVLGPDDVTAADRAAYRRLVAQRCLFGVDLNPMAVHLGRLSLWLATLSAGRPLTFLDHHLRTGNSLVGASVGDLLRQQRPGGDRRRNSMDLPLFADAALDDAMGLASGIREAVANEPGETVAQVRAKERALGRLAHEAAALTRWHAAADLWCSGWFRDDDGRRGFRQVYPALADRLLRGSTTVPERVADRWLDSARSIAAEYRFFHWTLEFPEVFFDGHGSPRPDAGFDAVLGNPPWEMLRHDGPRDTDAGSARVGLSRFARGAGIYRWQGEGHTNLYQLFAERAVALLRRGGRLGLILPSGFALDHGCARLRRGVLDSCRFDTFTVFENRAGVFPIHRGLKFLLVAGSHGSGCGPVPVRAGMRAVDALEQLPDQGVDPAAVSLSRGFLSALSGEQLAIPEIRSPADRDLVAALAARAPALGSAAGWNVHFGRELNATEDRGLFSVSGRGMPVIDGKHLQPFAVDARSSPRRVTRAALAGRPIAVDHARLAYRDVSSPLNRLTLIAAVVPAGVVTTHTLFCMRGGHRADLGHFLCGVFNSFVANYLVRLRVTTHVTVAIVEHLPVPVVDPGAPDYQGIAGLARRLARDPADGAAAAVLQAAVARLYGLGRRELEHVLDSFPLIGRGTADAVLAAFTV